MLSQPYYIFVGFPLNFFNIHNNINRSSTYKTENIYVHSVLHKPKTLPLSWKYLRICVLNITKCDIWFWHGIYRKDLLDQWNEKLWSFIHKKESQECMMICLLFLYYLHFRAHLTMLTIATPITYWYVQYWFFGRSV